MKNEETLKTRLSKVEKELAFAGEFDKRLGGRNTKLPEVDV